MFTCICFISCLQARKLISKLKKRSIQDFNCLQRYISCIRTTEYMFEFFLLTKLNLPVELVKTFSTFETAYLCCATLLRIASESSPLVVGHWS